jgi:hypothetical protein
MPSSLLYLGYTIICFVDFLFWSSSVGLDYMEPYGRVTNEWLIRMELEDSNRGLIEVLSRSLLGETEDNHEKPQSR